MYLLDPPQLSPAKVIRCSLAIYILICKENYDSPEKQLHLL